MVGYEKDDDATALMFRVNPYDGLTWGHSGDIGHVDEDGDVFIDGARGLVDSVKPEGEIRAYAFSVDMLFSGDEKVEYCKTVVRKIFDETEKVENEALVTHVKPTYGTEPKELLMHVYNICIQKLDRNNIPFAYKIRETIPTSESGKKDIVALRKDGESLVRIIDGDIINVSIDDTIIDIPAASSV